MTVAIWETMEKLYLKGSRSARGLAREMGISDEMAERAINVGYPKLSLPPLKDRAAQHDKARDDLAAGEAARQMAQEADDFGRIKRDNLRASALMRNSGLILYLIARQGLVDPQGNLLPGVTKAQALEAGKIMSMGAASIKAAGDGEMKWVYGAAPETKKDAQAQLDHMLQLTEEQCNYMAANPGRLPPGVTQEMWAQMQAAILKGG